MANGTVPPSRYLLFYPIPSDKKDDFLKFVTEGKKRADGSFEKDANGAEMTGVIAWANSEHLIDTYFYTVEKDDGSLLFIATANSLNPDWARIPGFVSLFGPNTRMETRDDLNMLVNRSPHP
jgi:hypothetical protein